MLLLAGEALRFVPGMPFAAEGSLLASGIHAPLAGAALKALPAGGGGSEGIKLALKALAK